MTVNRGNSQDLAQLRQGHSVDRSETTSDRDFPSRADSAGWRDRVADSRYAGGSAGVLPRTRRSRVCDSRNLMRSSPSVTAGQPARQGCMVHVHAKTALTESVRHPFWQLSGSGEGTGQGVPLENRVRLVTCGSSARQAACVYSLIRPPRTGFRRIRSLPRSVAAMQPGPRSSSGTRWAMPWCGRAML